MSDLRALADRLLDAHPMSSRIRPKSRPYFVQTAMNRTSSFLMHADMHQAVEYSQNFFPLHPLHNFWTGHKANAIFRRSAPLLEQAVHEAITKFAIENPKALFFTSGEVRP